MNDAPASRREFVRGTLRWMSAGLVVGATAVGSLRRAGADCRRPTSICGECPVYSGCDLPKAASYREQDGAPDPANSRAR